LFYLFEPAFMSLSNPPSADGHSADLETDMLPALVALCTQVLPVWARQLASSRSQSEVAVTEMLSAFTEIGPHLDRAARQSRQITQALAQGEGGITNLAQACEKQLQTLTGLDAAQTATVQQVMAMVNASVDALEQISKPFDHETQMVSQQVERMYKGFQYQDRISQMMTLLHEDIERLQLALASPGAAVDAPAWLARLQSQYVMAEQFQQHTNAASPDKPATDDDELTFF
jgi:ABC-type transporter Mla subunit MlaD